MWIPSAVRVGGSGSHRTRKQLSKASFALPGGDKRGAEHMGANLLPCNAAVRLQARTSAMGVEKKVGMIVAKVIEFYIPNTFRKRVVWILPEQCGKVIEFCPQVKKSA